MEAERRVTLDRTLVPNRFVVHLHPDDLAGFGDLTETLAVELADGALTFARTHHFSLADRPRVDLRGRRPRPARRHPGRGPLRRPAIGSAGGCTAAGPRDGCRARPLAGVRADERRRSDPTATRVFTLPQPVDAAGGRGASPTRTAGMRRVTVGGGGLTIGRADDNDLVARDDRVSRHHGRIAGRRGTLVYVDLGSTNGSRVNGEPVTEVVLGVGDRLEVGAHDARRRGSRRGPGLMDGFTLVLWGVRLLFLLLLYLFLARVIRVLLRDLRAAAREPVDRPGRLVVLESPAGEPGGRPVVRARRHHDARARRQQRDRHRRPVRVGRPCRADLPRPDLVPRGPRQHQRVVRQRPPGRAASRRSATATSVQIGQVRMRLERTLAMAARAPAAAVARRCHGSSVRSARAPAGRSSGCWGSSPSRWPRAACRSGRPSPAGSDCTTRVASAIYLGALLVAHLAQVLAGRRTDQVLLPAVGDARRDLAPADGAAAPGPGRPALLRRLVRPRRRPAHLARRRDRGRDDPRDRGPLGQLAAPLQVHLGGGRGRAPAAHVRARHRDQRPAPDARVRTDQRPAVRAAQGHPGGLPGRLPVGEPGAARRAGHPGRAAASAAAAVPRADGRDVGDRPRDRRRPARPRRGAAVLRRVPRACSMPRPGGSAWSSSAWSCSCSAAPPWPTCSSTSGRGSTSGSTRSPTRSGPATR